MVMLAATILSLNEHDWFAALSLKYAYFHSNIHLAHSRFLCFMLGINYFQYKVLRQGLSTAPRIFMKVAAFFHRLDCYIFPYLDDWLLKGQRHQ